MRSHFTEKFMIFCIDCFQGMNYEYVLFLFVLVYSEFTVDYAAENVGKIVLSIDDLLLVNL